MDIYRYIDISTATPTQGLERRTLDRNSDAMSSFITIIFTIIITQTATRNNK